jgi:Domain of unknown function (DUF4397)
MLVTSPAASALASSRIRLVNARGGADEVRLEVSVGGQTSSVGDATAFGRVGDPVSVPSGDATLSLEDGGSAEQEKTLAEGASYTIVALPRGESDLAIQILRNGTAIPREAKLRIVHAAPELGTPDFRLGDRTIAQGLGFRDATKYVTVDPGTYTLAVTRPDGGDPVFKRRVSLAAGTATTVVAAGSGGSPQRLIEVDDATVTPAGAPHTGLGGLAQGDDPWLLALLAALAAGALGGAIQLTRLRRAR